MLLQTLVQLNILILATPALAGWSLLPLAQPGVVRAACVVLQCRTAESVAPKPSAETTQAQCAACPQTAALPCYSLTVSQRPADQVPACFVVPSAVIISCNPFPHATRAP